MKLKYDIFCPPKEGPVAPVVMLHCAFDSRKTWKNVAPKIADVTGRKVYVPDARNHGDSPWNETMSWHILVGDLEEFLDEHNISRAVLVGHGMGGKTAFLFALKEPNRVERLISENAFPNSVYNQPDVLYLGDFLKKSLHDIPGNTDELDAKKMIMQRLQEQSSETPPLRALFDVESLPVTKRGDGVFVWKTNIDALLNFLASGETVGLGGTYRGDALFVYGCQSGIGMKKDCLISKLFPRSSILGICESGHVAHREVSDYFAGIVCHNIKGYYTFSTKL